MNNHSRILHIIPYHNLYPPMNGGQLRSFHLMDQLSKYFEMDVLCYQSKTSITEKGYKNKKINFYSTQSFVKKLGLLKFIPSRLRTAIRFRILTKTLFQSATTEVLEFSHVIKELSKSNSYDLIVFEHLTAYSLIRMLIRLFPNATFILDAHNVDHLLIKQIKANAKYYNKIKHLESTIYQNLDGFWACSQEDVDMLEKLNLNRIQGLVVPNGVDTESKHYQNNKEGLEKKILFCGSLDYPPNKEGLFWFYNGVWPILKSKIKDVELIVIGKGNSEPYKELKKDEQINFIGEVEEVTSYYKSSFISIVPLLSGSGTRLKVLEAMSFGNPIVSTSIGVEGIEITDEKDVLVRDNHEDFAQAINELVKNPELGNKLRESAYQLVKTKYDWSVIGNLIYNYLQKNE